MKLCLAIFIVLLSAMSAAADLEKLKWEFAPSAAATEALNDTEATRVVWWNIGCGLLNAVLVKDKGQEDTLYTNLGKIAQLETAPEIFILGEHCPGRLPKATKKIFDQVYSHQYHLEKTNPNVKTRNGILVLSKFPVKKISQQTLGPDDKTTRTYLLLEVQHSDGNFFLAPVHFYNPWNSMSGWDLLFSATGTDNVNYQQAEEYLTLLQKDVNLENEPLIVIGDFNSAKGFMWTNMATYNLFNEYLTDVGVNENTFPTAAAKNNGASSPDVLIDHVFTNVFEGKSSLLPLKGSDHYPVIFSF